MKKKNETAVLTIKNMVCDRCIRVVREELTKLGHDVRAVELGTAELGHGLNPSEREQVRSMLLTNGFELIEDRNARLIEAVRTAVIRLVHHRHDREPLRVKTSEYIASAVGKDYHTLSALFSSVENITIEQYIIKQRIERVKELLKYEESTLSQIADELGYSSVQHLSNQFKTITGLTPTQFKQQTPKHLRVPRIPLDKV